MTPEQGTDSRVDRLAEAVEANSQVVAQLAHGQKAITDVLERLATSQVGLSDSQSKLNQFVEQIEANLASTTAAVEHLERVVDYLLRRDKEIVSQDDE